MAKRVYSLVKADSATKEQHQETWVVAEDDITIAHIGLFKRSLNWEHYRDGSSFYFAKKDNIWFRLRRHRSFDQESGDISSATETFDHPDQVEPGSVVFQILWTFTLWTK